MNPMRRAAPNPTATVGKVMPEILAQAAPAVDPVGPGTRNDVRRMLCAEADMKRFAVIVSFVAISLGFQTTNGAELARWQAQAKTITIVRDDWGIAHVFGKTDADAVFGAIYAQAEDDFNRVETNYLNAMGRLAEAEGESRIYQDLRMKLFIDPDVLKKDYAVSPPWLQKLMTAWADGLNYYLVTHPNVKPRVITHFEPWMALSFTEGSIGGDIEKVNVNQLQAFYGRVPAAPEPEILPGHEPEPSGSNGMAVAPGNTTGHHSLLLINPHTSFYFRSELQMVSEEGLNAYGASTWGQFFIYQGFNDHAGWMHTSSNVDAVDEYLETVTKQGDHYVYKVGTEERPVIESTITVPYKTDKGMASKTFTVYRTHHGPVTRESNGKWVTTALMNKPIEALTESYTRTKATNYKTFLKTMDLFANSSNNTIFADSDGDIAYFHGNFIPRRDPSFDWKQPVDGSNPATDWKGLLTVDQTPHLLNPESGWIYNSNDSPWEGSGPSSLKKADYPAYVENGGPSARGRHAVRVLSNKKDFTLDGLIGAAYDSYQTWFEKPIPALLKAWDALPAGDPLKTKTTEQIGLLRTWDFRWSAKSIPTSLAIYWGQAIQQQARGGNRAAGEMAQDYIGSGQIPANVMVQALVTASDRLTTEFGSWQTPWGDINRFQRMNDDIASHFDDAGPSIPVMFSSANWGSLASFGARAYTNTKKWYGTSGNSFVAVVEFGPTVHAKAVTAGGESGDPKSKHFNDQAERYATGNLREVYFYKADLDKHVERTYHPGS
jgi:acyl-homoserine lactone acylase PvdQ